MYLLHVLLTNAQCDNAMTYAGTFTKISGTGSGTPADPYQNGAVVQICITIGGTYAQTGTNWFHGTGVSLPSYYTNLTPVSCTFPVAGTTPNFGAWVWSPGLAMTPTPTGPGGTSLPGYYYDAATTNGNPADNYGINTTARSGTMCFRATIANINTGTAISTAVAATSYGDGTTGSWNSGSCNADATSTSPVTGLQNIVLPTTLVSFTGVYVANTTVLNWVTATEHNMARFNVEKSANGFDYITVAFVQGAGNSTTTKNYTYSDATVNNPITYYRLAQQNIDGIITYSKIVVIRASNKPLNISVYPNPVINNTTISLVSVSNSLVTITIHNKLGQVVSAKQVAVIAGLNTIPVSITSLASGNYTIRVINQNFQTEKAMIYKQ